MTVDRSGPCIAYASHELNKSGTWDVPVAPSFSHSRRARTVTDRKIKGATALETTQNVERYVMVGDGRMGRIAVVGRVPRSAYAGRSRFVAFSLAHTHTHTHTANRYPWKPLSRSTPYSLR